MTEQTIPRPQPDTGGDGAIENIGIIVSSLNAIADCFESDGGLIINAPPVGPDRDSAVSDLRWLASHLPALMADAKLLDALVASPAHITVGNLTLREIRDHFRAGVNVAGSLTQGGRSNG